MFKNILLAADGSVHSKRAASKAIYLAQNVSGSKITLINVLDDLRNRKDILHETMEIEYDTSTSIQKEQTKEIEETIKEAGVSLEVKHVIGEPGPTIVEEANEGEYDIVIIGSRGLNPFQRMVLGSVSHKVSKRVKCPVLIIK
ncbi:universal stress protein [Evansella cellulosilytica]|uniref:UspA domain-containing protein n=1 Tax=Evansella cellulosilytica (strain ATCC 21833 / DSM 2522 / FERM P-1141 / JCM 9156 / N-4) TaxID=649639 RepID=E6U296_EVAC2|nr:universal stress protein [Evansella cellulosilytica]ADU30474.1 UspA domain-containing protein [Evansella cellulosilytica DSM 2522]